MNAPAPAINGARACRIVVSGRVQGVGFRPFVYRIALAHGLAGWVRNETGKVVIFAEGAPAALENFASALIAEAPPLAKPRLDCRENALPEGAQGFHILKSADAAEADIHLPPDLFCCPDCVAELHDPQARRYAYAFTNCTQCGPRYTIIERLPYDRPHTSMAGFALCPACRAEYENPRDRRFHAQPLACPECGPQLSFVQGEIERGTGANALDAALAVLRAGGIVAVKGVGGYHLLCDAADDAALARLRARKHRPHKPLAVMFPFVGTDGLDCVRAHTAPSPEEAAAITDPARPIVLVRKRADSPLGKELAPGLSELGVFLPYSPLHVLLLEGFGAPLVATSGNISGEPVLTDETEAQPRLCGIADAFLHHNRPIVRPADDSVVRIIASKARPIRLGRGLAPLEIDLPAPLAEPTLAVGGHMKGAIALGWGRRAVVSPHIGELDSPRSLDVFAQVIADLQRLYRVEARRVICDAHPRYASTRWAKTCGLPVATVQHHAAHASALAGEYPDIRRWLVFAWDGVGLGENNELWGGEAFCGAPGNWTRADSLRPFRILGADRAGREPWRSAAGVLWELGKVSPFGDALARVAWKKGVGTFTTSSAGRLFDAAAALVLGVERTSYEGQGPMLLESVAQETDEVVALPLLQDGDVVRIDWAPLLAVLADKTRSAAWRAAVFHESLAQAIAAQAVALARTQHFDAVGLTGGVFQNRILSERVTALLSERGMDVHQPQRLPANDGGLAFGQLVEAYGRDGMRTEP